jgi:hypothetical protein
MKILIEIEAEGETINETLQDVRAYCRIKSGARVRINGTIISNFKINGVLCDHPDHTDDESCEDRAIGCSVYCKCCMGSITTPIE